MDMTESWRKNRGDHGFGHANHWAGGGGWLRKSVLNSEISSPVPPSVYRAMTLKLMPLLPQRSKEVNPRGDCQVSETLHMTVTSWPSPAPRKFIAVSTHAY